MAFMLYGKLRSTDTETRHAMQDDASHQHIISKKNREFQHILTCYI